MAEQNRPGWPAGGQRDAPLTPARPGGERPGVPWALPPSTPAEPASDPVEVDRGRVLATLAALGRLQVTLDQIQAKVDAVERTQDELIVRLDQRLRGIEAAIGALRPPAQTAQTARPPAQPAASPAAQPPARPAAQAPAPPPAQQLPRPPQTPQPAVQRPPAAQSPPAGPPPAPRTVTEHGPRGSG